MNNLLKKYAEVLLNNCLKIENNQPLFISANNERMDFVRIVLEIALKKGVKDFYLDIQDPYIKHELLKELEVEDLKKLPIWNKEIWNEYAKKNAAFLMLASTTPGLMKDIDPAKINEMTKYSYETRKLFDEKRDKSELSWTIAAVPTTLWAKKLFPDSKNPVTDLWNKIFDICLIKEDNPQELWKEKIDRLKTRANLLNKYQFEKLIYKNSKGTNLEIELPNNHIWASGCELINNKKEVLVNFPTEEVFTSPNYKGTNGIVYSSKPLVYQDVVIDDFFIEFSKGKVINATAKKENDQLKEMINICENSDYLGEVALVEYDSPISKENIIFYETLYDENASCHLALGDSFPECIKNGVNIDKKELFDKYGLNNSKSHIDFMIGTKDLNIIGITKDKKEIDIIKNGNFTHIFK